MALHTEKQRGQFKHSLRKLPNRTHGNTNYRCSKSVMGVLSSAYVFTVSVDGIEPPKKRFWKDTDRRKA